MVSVTRRAVWNGDFNFSVVEEDIPKLKHGQVLVKVLCSGICGSDTHQIQGLFPGKPPPRVLGHEFSGEVIEVESSSNDHLLGKAVTCEPFASPCEGECSFCSNNPGVTCPEREHFGGFSEYLALPLSVIHEMPEGMDSLVGSLAEPASCCISGLKLARFESGMNVVITGAGIIGLLTGVFAKQFGANCVIISDPKKDRRDLAKKMGINITVDPTSENLSQVVVDNIGEFGCDIGIEAVGSLSLLEELFPIVKPRGTIQLAGVNPKYKNFPFDSFDFHFKEITLTGAFGKGNYFSEAVSCLSRLDFTDFKGKFYSLDNIVAGFKNSIDANDIKTFIKPHD